VRCGRLLMMGCLPSSSTVSPHPYRVNLEMHSEAANEGVWRFTWRPESRELGDTRGGRNRVRLELHSEGVIEPVWRCTPRP